MPKEPKDRLTEWQPQAAVPTWNSMSPGEKMAWLLNQALDCQREILTMPLPDPSDDSIEAHRIRMLVLAAADSTIEQSIRLQTNQLKPAAADDDIGELLEERLRAANTEIERLSAEDCKYGDGKPSKPNQPRDRRGIFFILNNLSVRCQCMGFRGQRGGSLSKGPRV